jgi:hypothetical protein
VRGPGAKHTDHRNPDKPFQNSNPVMDKESTSEAEPHCGEEECLDDRRESHDEIIRRLAAPPVIGAPSLNTCARQNPSAVRESVHA